MTEIHITLNDDNTDTEGLKEALSMEIEAWTSSNDFSVEVKKHKPENLFRYKTICECVGIYLIYNKGNGYTIKGKETEERYFYPHLAVNRFLSMVSAKLNERLRKAGFRYPSLKEAESVEEPYMDSLLIPKETEDTR